MSSGPNSSTRRGDDGLTMVELLVAMVITTVLAVLSVSGWSSYQKTTDHRRSAQELVSALRNAQQRALSEAVTYCVRFDVPARSYQVFRGCGPTPAGPPKTTASPRVLLRAPSFTQPDATVTSSVVFTPRGSATKGSVLVERQGSAKTYRISVEGLTGRVSLVG